MQTTAAEKPRRAAEVDVRFQERRRTRRIEFEKTKTEADQQVKIITAEAGIKVAQFEAKQVEERARGDAARVRMIAEADATRIKQTGDAEASIIQAKGEAQAKAYRDQASALTAPGVTSVEIMKADFECWSENHARYHGFRCGEWQRRWRRGRPCAGSARAHAAG